MAGAFAAAFAYELARTGISADAMQLAWTAAKMRFLAIMGKLAAGIALAALLLKQVVFFKIYNLMRGVQYGIYFRT